MNSLPFLLAQANPDAATNAAATGMAGFGVFVLILVAVASIFWLWMLIDCLTNKSIDGVQKIIWLLVIFFLHLLGALIYFFVGRGARSARMQ